MCFSRSTNALSKTRITTRRKSGPVSRDDPKATLGRPSATGHPIRGYPILTVIDRRSRSSSPPDHAQARDHPQTAAHINRLKTTRRRTPIARGSFAILSAHRGNVLEILVGQNGFRWDPEDSAHNGSDRDPCGSGPDCPKPHRAWAVIFERSDRGRPPRQNQVTTAR